MSATWKGGDCGVHAIIHKEEEWYVAECPDAGTVSPGLTIEEAIDNLKEAASLYLEEFPAPGRQTPILTTFEIPTHACV
ncbi:MAG: type II toxin-antitoxin system HicB family antitoxin [Acidobacteriota bacterium]|nr:type II toxin-antitoxin system HicB family antitoxin [Acidobacteriota bacterium]